MEAYLPCCKTTWECSFSWIGIINPLYSYHFWSKSYTTIYFRFKNSRFFGREHGKGYLMAAIIGAITPFCSCSTIPMLRGLLKAKAVWADDDILVFISIA